MKNTTAAFIAVLLPGLLTMSPVRVYAAGETVPATGPGTTPTGSNVGTSNSNTATNTGINTPRTTGAPLRSAPKVGEGTGTGSPQAPGPAGERVNPGKAANTAVPANLQPSPGTPAANLTGGTNPTNTTPATAVEGGFVVPQSTGPFRTQPTTPGGSLGNSPGAPGAPRY